MSKVDPLREFTPTPDNKGVAAQTHSPSETRRSGDGLAAIRSFFEDQAVTDLYSKENLGSGSYTQPGLPCHGGYEESDQKTKP